MFLYLTAFVFHLFITLRVMSYSSDLFAKIYNCVSSSVGAAEPPKLYGTDFESLVVGKVSSISVQKGLCKG